MIHVVWFLSTEAEIEKAEKIARSYNVSTRRLDAPYDHIFDVTGEAARVHTASRVAGQRIDQRQIA